MRYVIAVAETNSFTRAAERCLVVQSALSHQIARLERELGAKLFERTSRRVRLTPAGAAFLPAARQCLGAAERAAAEVAAAVGEVRGRLMVGLIPTVAAVDLPGILRTTASGTRPYASISAWARARNSSSRSSRASSRRPSSACPPPCALKASTPANSPATGSSPW